MSVVRRPIATPSLPRPHGLAVGRWRPSALSSVDRLVVGRWLTLAIFTILSGQSFFHLAAHHHAPIILAAWPALVLLAVRFPVLSIFVAAGLLRAGFSVVCCTDQIIVSQSAWERVISGQGSPYGVGYASTDPPGSPFPYGPLALVWWLPGPPLELVAAAAVMGILAWKRALLTLAVFAVWEPSVWLNLVGVNDYSPGLLLLLATLALRTRPMLGAAIISVAAALKPYAFAWFLPVIGYGGVSAAVVLFSISAVLWSPLFLWWGGVGPFLETVRLASQVHQIPNAVNLPALRWFAVPIAIAGVSARRWESAILVGSAAFAVFLFMDKWASYSYWLAILPATGLAIESMLGFYRPSPVDAPAGSRLQIAPRALLGGLKPAPALIVAADRLPRNARDSSR